MVVPSDNGGPRVVSEPSFTIYNGHGESIQISESDLIDLYGKIGQMLRELEALHSHPWQKVSSRMTVTSPSPDLPAPMPPTALTPPPQTVAEASRVLNVQQEREKITTEQILALQGNYQKRNSHIGIDVVDKNFIKLEPYGYDEGQEFGVMTRTDNHLVISPVEE
jgi:hypothetical protein